MILNRKLVKACAFFFLFEIISSTVLPTLSWALTAGPTAPEYTSFEPVDTTDMVNLATGDLVYNFPLLEVPGTSGGYPLSLSYHAGIMPEEEASWVGLGWTLNAGAISRMVNGYADDQLGATRKRTDYNSGGSRSTFSIGVGLPGVGYGLSISNDSNLGVGVGTNFNVGYKVGNDALGISASYSMGTDGYGNISSGAGIGLSVAMAKGVAGNVGIQTNFNTTSFSAGVNFSEGNTNILGASISSNGLRPSASVGGASINQVNSKAGAWNTDSFGFVIPVPLGQSGLFLNLGYNYFRYHMHESSDVKVVGSLHANQSLKNHDSWAFDSYALIDTDVTGSRIKDNDPEKATGGSFPAYDQYGVNAQGLNGSMQPYIFTNGTLFRQNLKTASGNSYLIEYKTTSPSFYLPTQFRFKNDFSNTHAYAGGEMIVMNNYDGNGSTHVSSGNSFETRPPDEGYNSSTSHLAGSKHTEWFTNEQISNGHAKSLGFIDYQPSNERALSVHNANVAAQIGGFMITNESGVTYHYALPVYEYGELSKSFQRGKQTEVYQINRNSDPYAYTWLLSAVTGPDYVDRDDNGMASEADWGYWVKFNYGMWTDSYNWRNPAAGNHEDLNSDIEFYSFGFKELYYLNNISTTTHTALFEKEMRADGKGIVNYGANDIGINPVFGFANREYSDPNYYEIATHYTDYSRSTLKLTNVFLIENKKLNEIIPLTDLFRKSPEYNSHFSFNGDYGPISFDVHKGDNVLDKHDLNTPMPGSSETFRDVIKKNSLRVVSFDHSYDLQDGIDALGVPNSFDPEGELYTNNPDPSLRDNKLGKLTLNAVNFFGKEGAEGLIPPTKFKYDKNPMYNKDAYDVWGNYKSDFNHSEESISRFTTSESAKNVDVWSLSTIISSLGSHIEIEYESDTYTKPVLYKSNNFHIKGISNGDQENDIKLEFEGNLFDLESFFKTGDQLEMDALHSSDYSSVFESDVTCNNIVLSGSSGVAYETINKFLLTVKEIKVVGNKFYIIVNSQALRRLFNESSQTITPSIMLTYFRCESGSIPQPSSWCTRRVNKDCNQDGTISPSEFCDEEFLGQLVNCRFNERKVTSPSRLCAGNINKVSDANGFDNLGGGIRVAKINLNSNGSIQTTKFSYTAPHTQKTSGVTSFEPGGINQARYLETGIPSEKKTQYENLLNDGFANLLKISREIPAPGVMYGYVTVEEEFKTGSDNGNKVPGKKVYEFQTFDERMIERVSIQRSNLNPVRCLNEYGQEVVCSPAPTGDINTDPYTCYDGQNNEVPCTGPDRLKHSPLILNDFSSWLGVLKGFSIYGKDDQLLTKTENHFLHDLNNVEKFKTDLRDKFKNQGKISQSFTEFRITSGTNKLAVFSMKNEYPLVPMGQTVIDYKTGIQTTVTNLGFDFYTGAPIKVLTTDGHGNAYVTEKEPAYKIDVYSGMTPQQVASQFTGMGLKVKNPKNKHMLSQEAKSVSYKVDPAAPLTTAKSLISASVQTWSNGISIVKPDQLQTAQTSIWRKHANFSYIGNSSTVLNDDGLLPLSNNTLPAFTAWNINNLIPAGWQRNGEIALYDVNSHTLSVKDINNNFASTKTSSDQFRVLATAANCQYSDFAYSGAEDSPLANGLYGGGVNKLGGQEVFKADEFDVSTTHTGNKALQLTGTLTKAFQYSLAAEHNRPYQASVWVNSTDGRLFYSVDNGVTKVAAHTVETNKAGSWYLITIDIPKMPEGTPLVVWCETADGVCNFDDFRVHPYDAAMISYVYNEWGELSHILNNNNLYTEYRYDKIGRLEGTYHESFQHGVVKTSETIYHYSSEN